MKEKAFAIRDLIRDTNETENPEYPKVELSYCWLHFRQELKEIDCVSETIGWVYEGYIDTITDVLNEVDGLLEDFYIVTLQFDKFAAYTDDGQCLCIYEKQ